MNILNSETDRLPKGLENFLSFWTTGRKNISFLTLKNWKNMYFLPKKAGILSFDRRGHHVLYNELIIQK